MNSTSLRRNHNRHFEGSLRQSVVVIIGGSAQRHKNGHGCANEKKPQTAVFMTGQNQKTTSCKTCCNILGGCAMPRASRASKLAFATPSAGLFASLVMAATALKRLVATVFSCLHRVSAFRGRVATYTINGFYALGVCGLQANLHGKIQYHGNASDCAYQHVAVETGLGHQTGTSTPEHFPKHRT